MCIALFCDDRITTFVLSFVVPTVGNLGLGRCKAKGVCRKAFETRLKSFHGET